MPSTDDLIYDLDDFHETQPQPEPETPPTAVPSKKSKKKGKKHAARKQLEEDEDTPYPKSVTPSPPADHGVRLDTQPPPPAEPEPDPEVVPEPHDLLDEPLEPPPAVWDDDIPVDQEPEPSKPAPAPSPAVRSPRPAVAKPASPVVSPPYRPATLCGSPQRQASFGGYRPASQPQAQRPRRESVTSQHVSPRPRCAQPTSQARFQEPLPPHMPQQHYFGLPDLGLNFAQKQEQGKPAGADGYCCVFDTFADAGDASSAKKARDALLVGSECGLDVYRVLPDKLEVVGRLEGLRGAVVDAKVLPHTDIYDQMQSQRPLVAVTIHGPMSDDRNDSGNEDASTHEQRKLYQTTIEVYSVQTQQFIATLYKSTAVAMEQPVMGHVSLPPKPVGELDLDAAGSFITVVSGKSGEIFVFSYATQEGYSEPEFHCVGKFWTALQQKPEIARSTSSNDSGMAVDESKGQRGQPLLSLNNRWLAIVPPYTSVGMPIQGSPALSDANPQPYGLAAHGAPTQPPLTCEVAGIDAEGTLSWLSRKAAQGLVKASQRGYEMGIQGWRELTHPSPPSASQSHSRATSQDASLFPPTNAPADDPKRLLKEPAIVSIIDLQRLLAAEEQRSKQAPAPLATFALVEGCNHLSFSPDGLRLMTSNRKGEVSTVWDLSHVSHGNARLKDVDEDGEAQQGPHVMQIHRIVRSSPSVVIDSVWSRDGDWLALLTTHGTVHLHEIPLTAPSKKRKRRSTMSATAPHEKAEPTVSMSQPGMSPPSSNGLLGSWRSWSQSVSTQVNAIRTQNTVPTTFAGFRETAAAAGAAGRKAVAKGIGQGYIAAKSGASDMWHAEDNKIRPKALQDDTASAGCIRWVQRQSGSSLAVTCGGSVYMHPVQRVTRRKGDVMVSGLKKDKHYKTFPLPRISTSRDGGAAAKTAKCAAEGPHGFWSLRHTSTDGVRGALRRGSGPSAAANEVETNPPYCPFHIDARVNIYAFDDSGYGSQAALHTDHAILEFKTRGHGYVENEEPWVFGEPLPSSTKVNDSMQDDIDAVVEDGDDEDVAAQVQSKLTIEPAGEAGGEQIRVNSRRSRRGSGGGREEGRFDMLADDDDDAMI